MRFHGDPVRLAAWGLAFVIESLATTGLLPIPAAAAAEEPSQTGPFRYHSNGRRDPFIPLVRDGQVVIVGGETIWEGRPMLYGILWDQAGESIALINDMEAKVGDLVSGYRVAEIRQDVVVLTVEGGEPLALQLDFEAPPKPSSGTTTGGEDR